MKVFSKSLQETHDLAKTFVSGLSPADQGATVVSLSGDLGAGKTAFMQGLAQMLGVEEAITSPTFVLEKIYRLQGQRFDRLVHIDAYRLEGAEELPPLGWDELLKDTKNLVCVEWGERIESALPEGTRWIRAKFIDTNTREIEIVA